MSRRGTDLLEITVKQVLLQNWDPIGIQDVPEAQDEYDGYVLGICRLLREGKSADELYRHLRWIEVDQMGLDGDEAHTNDIARKLLHLYRAL
jgi:hypothetical protein